MRVALAQIQVLVARDEGFDPRTAERHFRIGLPDSVEAAARSHSARPSLRRGAARVRVRLYSTDRLRLLDELDEDRIELGVGIGAFPEGKAHHKRRLLMTDPYLCMFNAGRIGLQPPISLEDYVRLPHVLTSLRQGERGVVDEALEKLGLSRTVVLTTPRFVVVPFLVAGAPVITTMHARLARLFAATLGLSLSPTPIALPEITVSLLWHASYDEDPGHRWLRQTVIRIAAESVRGAAPPDGPGEPLLRT